MRLSRAAAVALASFVLASVSVSARADEADKKKEAQGLFEKGVKQAKDGDARAALESFRGAYAAYPSYRVLFNIGQLCAKTGDNACAMRSYDQYLKDGGSEIPPARRDQVDAERKTLQKSVAVLSIKSTLAGADVAIDDAPVGKTPLDGGQYVNPGTHKVSLAPKDAPKDKRVDKSVTAAAGDALIVQIDPPKAEPTPAVVPTPPALATSAPPALAKSAPPPAPPPPQESHEAPSGRHVPIAPWAVTGGFAVATIVTGVFAANAYSSYKDKKDSFPVSRSDLDDSQSGARDLFIVTSVLGAATVIAAGVSTYFTFGPPSSSSASRAAPPSTRVGVAVLPGGFAVVGGFP